MVAKIIKFFDKFEDRVRESLSRHPIPYALLGGIAIVLFWRGVWMTADDFAFMTGPVSFVISLTILLASGLFVSFFIGDRIILSGLRQEKKLAEKTEEEVKLEENIMENIEKKLDRIEKNLEELNHRK